MKRFYLILVITSILFSCEEDLLDRESINVITEDKLWQDEALIESRLLQSYIGTTVFTNETPRQEHSAEKHFMPFMINSVSDESRFFRNWSGSAHKFKMQGLRADGEQLLPWWEKAYEVIRNLNEFIEKAPKSALDKKTIAIRVAEAKFLRAFNYFYMVKRYGGVPLLTKIVKQDSPEELLYPSRNKEDDVYQFIIDEVDDIVKVLPEDPEYGRASKYAALALKSRAALYAGSIAQFGTVDLEGIIGIEKRKQDYYYKESLKASEKIINSGKFKLYNKFLGDKVKNFRNIFLDERNAETIFAKQHDNTDKSSGGNGYAYDFFQTPKPNGWGGGTQNEVYLEMVESFEYIDGRLGKLDETEVETKLWTIDELWKDKDPRFFATIYTHGTPWKGSLIDYHYGIIKEDDKVTNTDYDGIKAVGAQARYTGFGVLKYLDESKDNLQNPYSSQTDWIVFRYGETLLNYAEAAFELGLSTESLQKLNDIRRRAGIKLLTSINREKIRNERKVELAFEGHRYWDLRRWRIAEEVLNKNHSGITYLLDAKTKKIKLKIEKNVDSWRSKWGKEPLFYSYNYYFPITYNRISKNKNLVENPGYN